MLEIRTLHQVFNPGSGNEIYGLRGIDLTIPRHQFATLIGSNGSGKTTLFNLIAGVFPPTRGQILIDGEDVTGWPEYRRASLVGRVFQDPLMGTADSMTIAENLTLALLRSRPLRLTQGVTRHRRKTFQEMLASIGLGLEDRLDTRVNLLSGGQRQALTLLMASLTKPKILLLDEHTAALDPETAIRIIGLTDHLVRSYSLTTIMITHNLKLALTYGERMLMLDRGKLVLDLNGEEKASMSVQDLLNKFAKVRQEQILDDKMLLVDY